MTGYNKYKMLAVQEFYLFLSYHGTVNTINKKKNCHRESFGYVCNHGSLNRERDAA